MIDLDKFVKDLEEGIINKKGFIQIAGEASAGYWLIVTAPDFNMVKFIETTEFIAMLQVLQVYRPALYAELSKAVQRREENIKLQDKVYAYNCSRADKVDGEGVCYV